LVICRRDLAVFSIHTQLALPVNLWRGSNQVSRDI
jgi:hypothetical protein